MTRTVDTPKTLKLASRRLRNGMTVLVHEDHKAPIVAMSLWYRVGSGHEPAGRHGFAHLFEHLMFSGSAHVPGGYFNAFAQSGARDLNGTTWFDRTNYFITVPVTGLERALWVESDRMANLLSDRSQAALDTQRGVISNEKMEGEARPYGNIGTLMAGLAFPEGHPYGHTTIGSMSDLADATLADVQGWYERHYGAANATLVLSGGISADDAFELVERCFGNIPPGPRPQHPPAWIPVPAEDRRLVVEDKVPNAFISRQWNCPPWGHPDYPLLEVAAAILSSGAGSRLYDRLITGDELATEVVARINRLCVTSAFGISVRCRNVDQVSRAERIVDEELARLLAHGPTQEELDLASSAASHGFSQSLEYVGGMSGQAATLAEGQCLRGDPFARWKDIDAIAKSTPGEVKEALTRWLGRPCSTIVMMPPGSTAAAGTPQPAQAAGNAAAWLTEDSPSPTPVCWDASLSASGRPLDRSKGIPAVGAAPEATFPPITQGRLANGASIHVARRAGAPMAELTIVVPRGFADESEQEMGIRRMALAIAMECPSGTTPAEFQKQKRRLGVYLWGNVSADHTTVGCSAPIASFEQAVTMLLAIIKSPLLENAAIDRYKRRWDAGRRSVLGDARRLVSTVLPSLVFGTDSPYGRRGGGSPTPATIASLDRAAIAVSLDRLWTSGEMAVFVGGDVTVRDVARLLDQEVVEEPVNLAHKPVDVAPPAQHSRRVFVVDFPAAAQVAIAGGLALPRLSSEEALPWRLMNDLLGGSFEGRLNQNLRESKGWAYGAGSSISEFLGASMLGETASVQVDKGVDALVEMDRELRDLASDRPPTAAEFERSRQQRVNAVGGRYETVSAVVSAMVGLYVAGDPFQTLAEPVKRLQAVQLSDLEAAARSVNGDRAVWLIAGPADALIPAIREKLGIFAEKIDAAEYL